MKYASENEIFFFDTLVHILILYTILYVLFSIVISTTSKKEFNQTIVNAIDGLNPTFFNEMGICTFVKNPPAPKILQDLENFYESDPDTTQKDFNNTLISGGGAVLIALFVTVLIAYLIMRYSAQKNVHLKHILIANLLLFATIGCIEMLFFFNVGNNYSPVLPSELEEIAYNAFKKIFP